MRERLYRFLRIIVRAFVIPICLPKVSGREHIPASGPVMVCSNHVSDFDPIIQGCVFRRSVRFMGKQELFGIKWFAAIIKSLGAFPVSRGGNDISAVRKSLEILKNDEVLVIFPQGHRYKHDDNRAIETGAALIALRSKAAVVPVHMTRFRLFRRMRISIGAPVALNDLMGKYDAESLKEATARIADGIWSGVS